MPMAKRLFSIFVLLNSVIAGWDRKICNTTVDQLLHNGTQIEPGYIISNNPSNYKLSILGCKKLCGDNGGTTIYSDAGPRLLTWLLPILLMITSIQFLGPGR